MALVTFTFRHGANPAVPREWVYRVPIKGAARPVRDARLAQLLDLHGMSTEDVVDVRVGFYDVEGDDGHCQWTVHLEASRLTQASHDHLVNFGRAAPDVGARTGEQWAASAEELAAEQMKLAYPWREYHHEQ